MLCLDRLNKRGLRSAVSLIAVIPLLTSCIVSYGVLAKADLENEPLSKQFGSLHYNVDPLALLEKSVVASTHRYGSLPPPLFDPTTPTRQTFEPLRRVFAENQIFTKTIPTAKPPEIGIFCSVDVTFIPHSREYLFAQALTFVSFGLSPSYSGESGFIMRYDLYIDGDLKKSYRYQVKRNLGVWLVLLPFVWVNALTPSQGEAVASTAFQFFQDAHHDGVL